MQVTKISYPTYSIEELTYDEYVMIVASISSITQPSLEDSLKGMYVKTKEPVNFRRLCEIHDILRASI